MLELSADQRKLLSRLLHDGRGTQQKIGADLKFPPKKMSDMIANLKKANVISRFTVQINYATLGYGVEGVFVFKIKRREPVEVEEIKKYLRDNPNIVEIYELFGREHDFMIRIMCRTSDELRTICDGVNSFENVDNTSSYTYAIARVDKREAGVPL